MKKYKKLAYKASVLFYDKEYENITSINYDQGYPQLDQSVYQYGWEKGVETMVPVAARIARKMGSEEIAQQLEKLLEQEE